MRAPSPTSPVPTVPGLAQLDSQHAVQMRQAAPESFSGDFRDGRPFLVQCSLHFSHQPSFPPKQSKVAFMISHMMGRVAAWATAEWARASDVRNFLQSYIDKKIFHHTTPGREAARALVELKQQWRCVLDYAIEFCTLATDSGWNNLALLDAFLHGHVQNWPLWTFLHILIP